MKIIDLENISFNVWNLRSRKISTRIVSKNRNGVITEGVLTEKENISSDIKVNKVIKRIKINKIIKFRKFLNRSFIFCFFCFYVCQIHAEKSLNDEYELRIESI